MHFQVSLFHLTGAGDFTSRWKFYVEQKVLTGVKSVVGAGYYLRCVGLYTVLLLVHRLYRCMNARSCAMLKYAYMHAVARLNYSQIRGNQLWCCHRSDPVLESGHSARF